MAAEGGTRWAFEQEAIELKLSRLQAVGIGLRDKLLPGYLGERHNVEPDLSVLPEPPEIRDVFGYVLGLNPASVGVKALEVGSTRPTPTRFRLLSR